MFEWITDSIWRSMLRLALERDIGPSGVIEAIDFWNAHFAGTQDKQKHVRPFAQAFTEFIGKPEQRTSFALHIIAAMHTKPEALPADPQLAGLPSRKQTETVSTLPPLDASLQAVIAALKQGVVSYSSDSELRARFDQVASSNLPRTRAGVKSAEATQIINVIYISLAEKIGPVGADRLLSQAIKDVEATATWRAYSPRLFL
jgi:hypothetical protein